MTNHTNVSFRARDGWPVRGSVYGTQTTDAKRFVIGDPVSGPMVFLNVTSPSAGNVFTETHFHGTDQFRVVLRGSTRAVGRHRLHAREFAFQEAGNVYREAVGGPDGELWMLLSHGDRRGARATNPRGMNRDAVDDLPGNPGGAKGIAGVATSFAPVRQGYVAGSFADQERWTALTPGVTAAVGVWGDRATGPLALMIAGEPGQAVAPAVTAASETLLLVLGGSCRIDGTTYEGGDLRSQPPSVPVGPVVADDHGVELVVVVGDRRGLPVADDQAGHAWHRSFQDLVTGLPLPLPATPL